MDTIMALALIGFSGLIIGWIGYSTITDNIIRDQEREIARLKRRQAEWRR